MKLLVVITVLACIALAQAKVDWATTKPKHMYVKPIRPAPTPKIVGGQEAEPHSLPFQVAIFNGGFCGGSLIRSNVVLTAAQCVDGVSQVTVVAGAHNLNNNEPDQQEVESSNIIVHEEWDSSSNLNDIALIILPSHIKLGATAGLVDLNEDSSSLDGESAIVSGWGRTSDSSGSISPVLRWVEAKIISNNECASYFPIVQPSNVCLDGSNGKGTCNGDSGGPLCVTRNDKPVQAGIVSFGSSFGCELGFPSVYTRVSSYIDWINKNLP